MPSGCSISLSALTSIVTEWFVVPYTTEKQCESSQLLVYNNICERSDAEQQWNAENPGSNFRICF